jgi:murein DD-endopeptidase MepM/ murein hydrolase activator NlpD
MNGRLYNPYLQRVLSPDNVVQNPGNSQNFNRYTYCMNNPLRYTDPSGNRGVPPPHIQPYRDGGGGAGGQQPSNSEYDEPFGMGWDSRSYNLITKPLAVTIPVDNNSNSTVLYDRQRDGELVNMEIVGTLSDNNGSWGIAVYYSNGGNGYYGAGGGSYSGQWFSYYWDATGNYQYANNKTTIPAGGGGSGLIYPIDDPYNSSDYGMRKGTMHYGVDLININGKTAGAIVYAVTSGKVVRAVNYLDGDPGGLRVRIQGNNGYQFMVCHFNEITVSENQSVIQGDIIGRIGGSGYKNMNYYGPHAHYEIWDSNGNRLNPYSIHLELNKIPKK